MRRYLQYGLLGFGMLTWTTTAQATSTDATAAVSTSPVLKYASDVPSAFIALAGVVLISMLDWLYVQVKKRRAYRRLHRIVALERVFHHKSSSRYH